MSKYDGYSKTYYNQQETLSSFETTADGSLLIHGVTVMAVGTWTDMHGITTRFTEEVLQRCAGAWDDNAVWTRHAGGAPRSVTEKVGAVISPAYSPTDGAVIADVLLHNRTDMSRACSELVQMAREQGGIKDVSAECMVIMDSDGTVTDLIFTGLALVEDGACETCRIPAYGREESDMADDEKKETTEVETKETEVEETETEVPKGGDLAEILEKLVEAIIPDTKELIEAIKASEGEDRIRAIGQLEGCMRSWGVPIDTYSKMLDDRLAEFSKALDDKLAGIQNSIAQYSAPAGLKGKMGAEKEAGAQRQTLTLYGSGRTALD